MLSTRVLKTKALPQLYSPVSSVFPPLLQRRFNRTSSARELQPEIENLKERCTAVFSLPFYNHVDWVGVYPPFFLDQNSPYIEFIIGLAKTTNVERVIRHSIQVEHFEYMRPQRGRKIRMEHMYYKKCYTLKMAHGLLTATTVYESSPAWLRNNRPLAVKNLMISRNRLEYALRLESEITKLVSVLSTRVSLISSPVSWQSEF